MTQESGEPAAIRPMTAATPTSMYNMTSMVQALPANNVAVPDARSRALAYPQYVQAPTSMSVGTLSRPSTSSSAASKATNGYSFSSSQAMSVVRSLSSVELEERIYTEGQAIHISRLPHNIEPEAVKKELSKYGKVSCIAVKRGKEKRCSATARFQSAAQAELAINKLNGSRWGKLNVTVRLDRSEVGSGSSSASVGTAGSDDSDSSGARSRLKSPLVVNGARGPVYHKTTLDADDSESEGQPPKGMFTDFSDSYYLRCLHKTWLTGASTIYKQDCTKTSVSPLMLYAIVLSNDELAYLRVLIIL